MHPSILGSVNRQMTEPGTDDIRPVEHRIDVLIPVFNAGATVRSAIDSIRAQTVSDIRIIVVDDGSTDETADILAGLARLDTRIHVITKPNGGIVDALNVGLAECTADYVARHDADDIAYPHRLETQMAYLDANADCIGVSSFARQVDRNGRTNGLAVFPPPESSDPEWVPCREPYLLHPFLMVRRRSVTAIGGYRHVHHAEDADLCWRLQAAGRLYNVPRMLGDYRVHALSITSRSTLNGRVSACNSQLAAISVRRRRNRAADLTFTKAAIEEMNAAGTMAGIFDIASRGLSADECAYLKPAFAAKFLELSSYRPYEPDVADCRFIGATLRRAESGLPPQNRSATRRLRAATAARLFIKGHIRAGAALVSPATLIETGCRFAIHCVGRCFPTTIRTAIWDLRCKHRALKLERNSATL